MIFGQNKRELAGAIIVMSLGFLLLYVLTEPNRSSKRQVHCATNLNRIGLAIQQYAQDNDETFPRSWFGRDDGPSDAEVNYKWMDAINPYWNEAESFRCPTDKSNPAYSYRSGTDYGSYVMNNAYYAPGDAYTPPAGAKMSNIERSSSTNLIIDGAGDFQFAWPDSTNSPSLTKKFPPTLGSITGRHKEKYASRGFAMTLFCDGHVKYFYWETISSANQSGVYTQFTIEDD